MKYENTPAFKDYERQMGIFEYRFGRREVAFAKLSMGLADKLRTQLFRVGTLIREEEPEAKVAAACLSMVKGLALATKVLEDAAVQNIQRGYVEGVRNGMRFRVWADRAGMPKDDDGHLNVSAEDLLAFMPPDVCDLLINLPGASVDKVIAAAKPTEVTATVKGPFADMKDDIPWATP